MVERPTAASLLFSEACNLNCSYCFEKNRKNIKMSKEVAIKAINMLFDNRLFNIKNGLNNSNVAINGFGGEPMLNFEVLSQALEEGIRLAERDNTIFTVAIITNGTIVNDEIVNFLKYFNEHPRTHLELQLSVDGLKESHDFYRVDYNGKGSFDRIVNNLPKFKEIFNWNNLNILSKHGIHVHGSLNKETIKDMHKAWKMFYYDWDIPAIWFMPIHSERWSEEDVTIYAEQLTKIANSVLDLTVDNRNPAYMEFFAPINRCLMGYNSGFRDKPCGAGDMYVSITANGTIYPCHQFYYINEEEFNIGNVFEGVNDLRRKLYTEYTAEDMNCSLLKCKNYTCYRCIAENYLANGTILNCEIGNRCKMSGIEYSLIDMCNKILIEKGLIND